MTYIYYNVNNGQIESYGPAWSFSGSEIRIGGYGFQGRDWNAWKVGSTSEPVDATTNAANLDDLVVVFDGSEEAIQKLKPAALKAVENRFLAMCDQLTQATTHNKLGFDIIEQLIKSIPDQATQFYLSAQLLAIDAEAKREGGNLWWDDCAWHQDIV